MKSVKMFACIFLMSLTVFVSKGETVDTDIYGDVIAIESNMSVAFGLECLGTNNTLSETMNISSNKVAVGVGFLDSDDKLDVILGADGSLGGWYESNGDDSLGWSGNSSSTAVSNGMVVGDFDKDGTGDLLFVRPDEKLTWYQCTGEGTLGWRSDPFGSGSGAKAIAMDDIDNDGVNDLIVAKTTGLNVYNPNGNFLSWSFKIDNEGHYISIATGDFDGDAYKDLFVVARGDTDVDPNWDPAWNGVVWYEFRDDPTDPNVPTGGAKLGFTEAMSVALGDVDGDGVNELIIGNKDRAATWYESDGNDSAVLVKGSFPLYNVSDMAIVPASCNIYGADFNGDCTVDLIDYSTFADQWLK
ncbi:MAG: FG-GAP repeat domain-containing protein [Sedimentisphaeraceae bacterium JB056]